MWNVKSACLMYRVVYVRALTYEIFVIIALGTLTVHCFSLGLLIKD